MGRRFLFILSVMSACLLLTASMQAQDRPRPQHNDSGKGQPAGGNSRMSGDFLKVKVARAGELKKEVTPEMAKMVRTLVIEGVINYDDIKVIRDICERSSCKDDRGKSISNFLDLDLSMAHFATTYRMNRNSVGKELFYGMTVLRSVRLPMEVRTIEARAFQRLRHLETVEMPQGVSTFEEEAFSECEALKHVTMPANLEKIGRRCFYKCSQLDRIRLPQNLVVIGDEAFLGCSLTDVQLPAGLRSLGYNCFGDNRITELFIPAATQVENGYPGGSRSLRYVEVERGNRYHLMVGGAIYNADATELQFVPAGLTGPLSVPATVTRINDYACYQAQISEVVMTENVNAIGKGAFQGCDLLQQVTIPQAVLNIEANTFQGCTRLTHIQLPSHLMTVGDYAFAGCAALPQLQLPETVNKIGSHAFMDCKGLNYFRLPTSITVIPKDCFRNCEGLMHVDLPSALVEIGDEAFRGCKNLPDISLPEGLRKIGDEAFRSCSNFTTVDLPASVTELLSKPFYKCEGLQRIICRAVVPPSLKSTDNKDVPLFVPAASVDAYQKAKTWKKFKTVLPIQ